MQKEFYSMIFEFLSRHIGKQVSYTVWRFGRQEQHDGFLENVISFEKIVIDRNIVPFVGENVAIEEIRDLKSNKVIYSNPRAIGYNIKDPMGVMLAQQEMLGYSVDMEALEESMNRKRKK